MLIHRSLGVAAALLLLVAPRPTQSSAATPPSLADIAAQVGLAKQTNSFFSKPCVLDANRDGLADLVLMNHGVSKMELFEQMPSRTFVRNTRFNPPVIDPHGCTVLDVNQDGYDDVYIANGACSGTCTKVNQLMVRAADGSWTDQAPAYGLTDPLGRGRVPLAFDADGDRYRDLFLGNEVSATRPNRVFRGTGTRMTEVISPALTRGAGAGCAASADIDRDRRAELIVCTRSSGLQVYEFDGRGFVPVDIGVTPGIDANGAAFGDVDGDGDLDLAIVTERHVRVHINTGSRLTAMPTVIAISAGRDVVVADANGDRRADVFVVQGNNATVSDVLLIATSSGVFTPVTAPRTGGDGDKVAAIADYLGPGRAAFVVNNGRYTSTGPRQVLVLR